MARRNRVLPVFSQSFVSLPSEYGCPQNQFEQQKISQNNSLYTGWRNFTGWSNCTTSREGIYQVAGADNYEGYVGAYTYRKLVPLAMNVTGTYVRGQAGLTDSNLTNQVIGQYASPALWLGLMGINPIASSSNDPPSYPGTPAGPTFFETQASLDHIASRSWAYTAGTVNSKISSSCQSQSINAVRPKIYFNQDTTLTLIAMAINFWQFKEKRNARNLSISIWNLEKAIPTLGWKALESGSETELILTVLKLLLG